MNCWQFYFVLPDLITFLRYLLSYNLKSYVKILLDFKLVFENVKESGLIDSWPAIKDVPYAQFAIRLDKKKYPVVTKNDDIYKIFMYLNLLPTPKNSFEKAVENLLVYTEVS